jgi:hypothetical protein
MGTSEKQSTVGSPSSTEGSSWQFRLVLIVIVIGVLGLIAKTLGTF